jgi:hypothetical protein
MINKKIGISMPESEMKAVKGGYVKHSACSISGCATGTFACCNKDSCTCEANGTNIDCHGGGEYATSCTYGGTFSSLLEP